MPSYRKPSKWVKVFWDKVASVYDFFENVYNGKVYKGTGQKVAKEIEKGDEVLWQSY